MSTADRSAAMNEMPQPHIDLNWMLDELVAGVAGARHAVVLSTDGMLIQKSSTLGKDDADHLAAIASTLQSVAKGTSERFQGGLVRQTIVEMQRGFLFVTAAGPNACLGALTEQDADLGMIGYEMNRLVKRVGAYLSSAARTTPVATTDGAPRA
jgi:predicted regulator of Ras-like GTPase activity (Roadblock/LC7/MglB family)